MFIWTKMTVKDRKEANEWIQLSWMNSATNGDPDLTEVQLKLILDAEPAAQGGDGGQGDGVRVNHGH